MNIRIIVCIYHKNVDEKGCDEKERRVRADEDSTPFRLLTAACDRLSHRSRLPTAVQKTPQTALMIVKEAHRVGRGVDVRDGRGGVGSLGGDRAPDHIRCSIGDLSARFQLFNAAQATAAALGATRDPMDLVPALGSENVPPTAREPLR